MQAAGGDLVKHYRDLAFMGFWEVVKNLGTIMKNLAFCKSDILAFRPDTIVLIDYPGFNLRIATWAKQQGLRVVYYISPQVWAWKEDRVKTMKESIDKMIVILPFEKEYYREKWNWEVEYVGHPLVDVIDQFRPELPGELRSVPADKKIVALLPGSRKQEILKKLPVMLEASRSFPDQLFVVAKAPGIDDSFYEKLMKGFSNVSSVANRTYDLLSRASAALVTSGTATLETALFGVPEVVCYKGSAVSYQIARRVIKVKYISLVNLIMGRRVVPELIQREMNAANLGRELLELLNNKERIAQMKKDYAELRDLLGMEGDAAAKAAEGVVGAVLNTK